ncbi:MAG TPA: divergent PAP2 family protein [Candidatus Omnitrophota bacterium]|nr:divergent PAP2 family protein [Candidatus Omnitrophota bacterium]
MQSVVVTKEFVNNPIAICTFCAWLVAQSTKVFLGVIREKKFNFRWFAGSGGFPSSHSAGVTALATSVGLHEGVSTALFVVTLMFSIVVILDAQGVRRSAGQQATILNKIMDDLYWKGHIQENRLKELIGHTPFQTFTGIIIGLAVALILFHYVL